VKLPWITVLRGGRVISAGAYRRRGGQKVPLSGRWVTYRTLQSEDRQPRQRNGMQFTVTPRVTVVLERDARKFFLVHTEEGIYVYRSQPGTSSAGGMTPSVLGTKSSLLGGKARKWGEVRKCPFAQE